MVFSLLKKKCHGVSSHDGAGSSSSSIGTGSGSKSVNTVLVEQLQKHNWSQVLTRLRSHPSEAKTWTKVELDNVGTNSRNASSGSDTSNNRRRLSAPAASEGRNDDYRSDRHLRASENITVTFTTTTTATGTPASLLQQSGPHHPSRHGTPELQRSLRESCSAAGTKEATARCKVLPLHVAMIEGAPLNVIEALLKANREAIVARDGRYNRYPLHFGCLYHPRLDVIRFLVTKDKSSCRHKDVLNRTAIHYAAFGCAPLEVFDLLLEEYPKGVKVADMLQWLPLHVAARMSCSFDVLRRLVEAYPQGLNRKTRRGSTPVHIATRFFGPGSVLESQLHCLQAAVETIYDLGHGRLNLELVTTSNDYWLQRQAQSEEDGNGLLQSQNSIFPNDNHLDHSHQAGTAAANDHRLQDVEGEEVRDADQELGDERTSNPLRSSECSSTGPYSVEQESEMYQAQLSDVCHEEDQDDEEEIKILPSNLTLTQNVAQRASSTPDLCCDVVCPTISIDSSAPCVVCFEEARTHAFVPCGHMCVCEECSMLSLTQSGGIKCPLCRKKSFIVMKVFS